MHYRLSYRDVTGTPREGLGLSTLALKFSVIGAIQMDWGRESLTEADGREQQGPQVTPGQVSEGGRTKGMCTVGLEPVIWEEH